MPPAFTSFAKEPSADLRIGRPWSTGIALLGAESADVASTAAGGGLSITTSYERFVSEGPEPTSIAKYKARKIATCVPKDVMALRLKFIFMVATVLMAHLPKCGFQSLSFPSKSHRVVSYRVGSQSRLSRD